MRRKKNTKNLFTEALLATVILVMVTNSALPGASGNLYTNAISGVEDDAEPPTTEKPFTGEPGPPPPPPFTDLPGGFLYTNELSYLKNNGIFTGYEDGSFKPDNPINRAELIKTVMTAKDLVKEEDESGGAQGDCFTDVHDEWFAPYVCVAKMKGWIKGYEDGSFKPGNNVTQAEALKMIMTPFEINLVINPPSDQFNHLSVDLWYAPYVWTAEKHNLLYAWNLAAMPDFQQNATRLEVATALYQVMNQ